MDYDQLTKIRNIISSTILNVTPRHKVLFKSAGASVQSTTGSRVVRISGSNAGYTMFRGSVKGTGYPLHSPVYPSLPLPCVAVCHHILTELYLLQETSLLPGFEPWIVQATSRKGRHTRRTSSSRV